jgi:3-(3-hydroxy-phenyl)propionate hydroxylase
MSRAFLVISNPYTKAQAPTNQVARATNCIYSHHMRIPSTPTLPKQTSVLIVGGGPVGMTLAALLAKQNVKAFVIEADGSYCTGSRAICVSRRSQEILSWAGAESAMRKKALPWTGGRSYYRDKEVLHFKMPTEPTERFAPMVNIQQFYVEQFAHESGGFDVAWNCKVLSVQSFDDHSDVVVQLANGSQHTITCDWLAACDGGKSTVREQMGLSLEGIQYEGRYVIVDIEQDTQRDVERLAWFDPPSNPGSTILMHRQPDNIWRIDYQVADNDDPVEAVKPENVLPRVQSHLDMIGETAPWKAQWISIYNAKCLTLPNYRKQRVFFLGDAAHLVPIFGVRGLNSGVDDAANLAWKLASVIQGKATNSLLDTYSQERLHATNENIQYGAKSTEFMAPPHEGFKLMREAALRLSLENPAVNSLINPRQSLPIEYVGSALNIQANDIPLNKNHNGPRPGMPAPEAELFGFSQTHLSQLFGKDFVALRFSDTPSSKAAEYTTTVSSQHTQAWSRYAAKEGRVYLIRPDGYIMATWMESNTGNSVDVARLIDNALKVAA